VKRRRVALAALLLLAASAAGARTTVEKPARCTVVVRIPIELSGPAATQELADRWEREIESEWNGPTTEMIARLAREHGLDPKQDAERLDRLGRELLAEAGVPEGHTRVNCCNIRFEVEIRLGEGTAGYHQVRAVPEFEEKEARGRRIRVRFRDFVRGAGWAHADDASGTWADAPAGRSEAAHEAGHLMGLGDEYEDSVLRTESGEVFKDPETGQPIAIGSHPKPGHELDLMANETKDGWPMEDAIRKILELGGVECDCCPKETSATAVPRIEERIATYTRYADDAIRNCHETVLASLLEALASLRAELESARGLSWLDQAALRLRIRKLEEQIRRAQEECAKKRVATGGPPPLLRDGDGSSKSTRVAAAPPTCGQGERFRIALVDPPPGRWHLLVEHELGPQIVQLVPRDGSGATRIWEGSVPLGATPESKPEARCTGDDGSELAKAPLATRIAPEEPIESSRIDSASRLVSPGGQLCACGRFVDPEAWNGLALGGQPLGEPLAASGRAAIYRVPATAAPGRYELSAPFPSAAGPVGVVRVVGAIDQERLWRGGSTDLRLVVEGTEEPLPFVLSNRTPGIVRLPGGDRIEARTSGGKRNRWETKVEAVQVGDFDLSYDFAFGSCPCAP
jgi:hypothetical protein